MDKVHAALQRRTTCVGVQGPSGCGKSSFVAQAANAIGARAVKLEPVRLHGFIGGGEADKALRRWAETALEEQAAKENKQLLLLLIDDAHLWFSQERSPNVDADQHQYLLVLTLVDIISSLAGQCTKVVIVLEDPLDLHPFLRKAVQDWVEIGIPNAHQREGVWLQAAAELLPDVPQAVLQTLNLQCHGWTFSDILSVCHSACQSDDGTSTVKERLTHHVNTHRPLLFRGSENESCPWTLIPSHRVSTTWESIGGLQETKQALKEVVIWPMVHARKLSALGLDRPPSGVLLYGPPGTGKTLLASAVAKESDANFMSVSIGDIIRGHVGESEKLLARAFAMARSVTPCVLFFDEFQALFGNRETAGQVGQKLVSQFLLETDRAVPGLFLLAATNLPDVIDPALLRPGRFDRKIHVPLPDQAGREYILQHLRDLMGSWDSSVCIKDIVDQTSQYSGAEIDALCQRAALVAVENDDDTVLPTHFEQALNELRIS